MSDEFRILDGEIDLERDDVRDSQGRRPLGDDTPAAGYSPQVWRASHATVPSLPWPPPSSTRCPSGVIMKRHWVIGGRPAWSHRW